MHFLFISSLNEDLSNPAYSRQLGMKKLFSELGDIQYLNLFSKSNGFFKKVSSFLNAKRRVKKALSTIDLGNIDAIFLSTIPYNGMKYIKKVCLKNKIKLIIDCVEYASPEEKKFGRFSLSYIHNTRINEHLIDKNVYVISISSYLYDFFKSKDIKTVVIPNLVDTKEINYVSKEKHSKIELLFAGYPQKKDALNIAVEGLLLLSNEERDLINLTVAGINEEQFFEKYPHLVKHKADISLFVSFKGKLPSEQIKKLYKNSDFSVLIRDDSLRVCNAGFPTKLLDSFKYSTPIIANLTSDIGKYLIDQVNGFIVKNYSKESCYEVFKNIVSLFKENKLDIDMLSKNAFDTCIKSFNYLDYVDRIKALIND